MVVILSASPLVRHLASGSPVFLSFRSAVLSFRASSKRLGRKAAQNVKLLLARLWHILPPFLPLVSPFPTVLCYPVERPLLQLLQISDDFVLINALKCDSFTWKEFSIQYAVVMQIQQGRSTRGRGGEEVGGIGHSLPSLAKDLLTGNPRATDIKSIYQMKIDKLSFYPITKVYLKRTNEVYIVYICRWLYIYIYSYK